MALPVETVIRGNPPLPTHEVNPVQLTTLLEEIQANALSSGNNAYYEDTLTELQAISASDDDIGFVFNDTTSANNGTYRYGSSTWTKTASLPVGPTSSAVLARKWANESENTVVEDSEFSAKHYSAKSSASATAAATSAGQAASSATTADTARVAAQLAETNAEAAAAASGAAWYADTTAFLAGTSNGDFGYLPELSGVRVYENVGGVATARTWLVPPFVGIYNVKDYGALGDNATDDSAAFQAAVDAVPAGGGTVFVPPGDYVIVTGIEVTESYTRIRGAGYASHLILSASAPASTKIIYGNKALGTSAPAMKGVSIRGLRVNGRYETASFPTGQEYECVNFNNTEDFDFCDNWVEGAGQDGLDLDGFNRRANVRNNVFYRNRMQAIHLYGGDNSVIEGNWCIECGQTFVSGTTAETTGVIDTPFDPAETIGHLHVGTHILNNYIIDCSTGIHCLASTHSRVSGNYVALDASHTFATVGMAIWASDVDPANPTPTLEISGNTIIGPWLHGIRAPGRIIGNHIEGCGTSTVSAAIHTRPREQSVVIGNTIDTCAGYGMWFVGPTSTSRNTLIGSYGNDYVRVEADGCSLSKDRLLGTSAAYGINVINTADVDGCEVTGFASHGIRTEGASAAGSNITGNTVDGGGTATQFGIQAVSGANNCRLSGNKVTGIASASTGAVGILSATGCTMDGNEARGCNWSFVIGASTDDHIVFGNVSRDPVNAVGGTGIIVSGSAGTGINTGNHELGA